MEEGTVTTVAERRNSLVRPVIANVDQALLVFSLVDPPLSLFQLDKLLAAVEFERISSIAIAFTKVDLPGAAELYTQAVSIYEPLGYPLLALSLQNGEGRESLIQLIKGRVTVLAGLSGVGKSTMLQSLLPDSSAITGTVSDRSHRGRHTTTHVELFAYADGFIADTPGFSQIDLTTLELPELATLFREIDRLAAQCEFRGCLHEGEQGCAVRFAVEQTQLTLSRYEHYLQLLGELKEAKARRY